MSITSLYFVLLSILSLFVFYSLKNKFRIPFLVILSCVFIASYSPILLIYVLTYAIFNYFLGLKIAVSFPKKTLYRLGIFINLAQLILLKYSSFIIDPIFSLLGSSLRASSISEIIIPIGVSYFSLQGIGYLINIKMAWEKPEKNFIHFLFYISFFPKFLSGPVERSNHLLPQLQKEKSFDRNQVTSGLRIALFGMFKKLAIANQLAPYVIKAYADLNAADGYSLWILFLIVPLYLYFDFSGYTDIAIGLAKTFGFELLPNFNRPFFSENVTAFWKRFHISLSSWFNDYVFRQTSFKYRKWGIYASILALIVTWTLFGIWHGAGWNFMMLGFLQAVAIIYEFFTKKVRQKLFGKLPDIIRIWVGRIFTYLFYCLSLIFFFSPDLKSVMQYFTKMFNVTGPMNLGPLSLSPFSVMIYIPIFLLMELLYVDFNSYYKKLEMRWESEKLRNRLFRWFVYSLTLTLLFVVGNESGQFIYVNF